MIVYSNYQFLNPKPEYRMIEIQNVLKIRI